MSEDEAIKFWMDSLVNRASVTKDRYLRFLLDFSKFLGKTPDEIYYERVEGFLKNSDDPRQRGRYENLVKNWINQLKKRYSIGSCRIALSAIKGFFEVQGVPLKLKSDFPGGQAIGSRAITKEELRSLTEDVSLYTKTIVYMLKDTGLRVSDLRRLTYGDVRKGLENNDDFIPIKLRTKKSGTICRTFLGSESINLLKQYLKGRREGTRRIPPETIIDESPLIRSKTKKIRPVSRGGLTVLILHHLKRVGLADEDLSAHSIRKYTQTQLDASGIPANFVDVILGHKLAGVRGSYSMPSEKQLLEAYKKGYDNLRIDPIEFTHQQLESVTSQLRELDNLRLTVSLLKEKLEEEREWRDKVEKKLNEEIRSIKMEQGTKFPGIRTTTKKE